MGGNLFGNTSPYYNAVRPEARMDVMKYLVDHPENLKVVLQSGISQSYLQQYGVPSKENMLKVFNNIVKRQEAADALQPLIQQVNAGREADPLTTEELMLGLSAANELGLDPNSVEYYMAVSPKLAEYVQGELAKKQTEEETKAREGLAAEKTRASELLAQYAQTPGPAAEEATRTVFVPPTRNILGPQAPSRLPMLSRLRQRLLEEQRKERLGGRGTTV